MRDGGSNDDGDDDGDYSGDGDGEGDGDGKCMWCASQRSGHLGLERWKLLQLQSGLGEQPPNNKHRPGEQDFNLSRITSSFQ